MTWKRAKILYRNESYHQSTTHWFLYSIFARFACHCGDIHSQATAPRTFTTVICWLISCIMWCVLNVKYNHSTSLWPVNDHSWLQSVQWLCGVMIPLSTCCCTYTAVYIRTSRGRAVAMRVQWICVAALIIRWLVAARDDRSSNDTQSPTSLTLVPIRSQLLASSLLPPSTVCLPRTAQLLCSIDWLDLTWSILLPLYMRVSVGYDRCLSRYSAVKWSSLYIYVCLIWPS